MPDGLPDDVRVTPTPGPLPPVEAAAVRALADRAAAVDGVAPLSEQPLLWLADPEADVVHLVATGADGTATGYAQVEVAAAAVATAELVVEPSARRTGLGTALLDAALAQAARVPGRELRVWAHGDLPAARAFASSAGLVVVRELWRMSLDLSTPPPARPLPRGVTVRPFVPGQDEDAWRRVNSRAFAHHPEQGRITAADLRAREAEPWFDPEGFLLAERDGSLLGSVWTKVQDDVGEIYVVGVDPDAQGLGLGGALTALGLAHLRARGLGTAVLYTDAENTVAVRTYTRAGFVTAAADVMYSPSTQGSPTGATMST